MEYNNEGLGESKIVAKSLNRSERVTALTKLNSLDTKRTGFTGELLTASISQLGIGKGQEVTLDHEPTELVSEVYSVKVSDLVMPQEGVTIEGVMKYIKGASFTLPTVVFYRNKYVLDNGNHRVIAQVLAGRKVIACRVVWIDFMSKFKKL